MIWTFIFPIFERFYFLSLKVCIFFFKRLYFLSRRVNKGEGAFGVKLQWELFWNWIFANQVHSSQTDNTKLYIEDLDKSEQYFNTAYLSWFETKTNFCHERALTSAKFHFCWLTFGQSLVWPSCYPPFLAAILSQYVAATGKKYNWEIANKYSRPQSVVATNPWLNLGTNPNLMISKPIMRRGI